MYIIACALRPQTCNPWPAHMSNTDLRCAKMELRWVKMEIKMDQDGAKMGQDGTKITPR